MGLTSGAGHSRRAFLSASAGITGAVVLTGTAGAADLRPVGGGALPPGDPISPQEPDARLRALLAQVDERRIEDVVRKLVSFGTRHTLSSQDDPQRGIGAARDWLFAEMQACAARSGGRMTVELQSYDQEPANRIPVTTRITNVVATIRGTTDPDRAHVVSGHYDSRATDVMDAVSDAPGADDDASGVAVVLELARLLAEEPIESTVVLAAVAAEEQGLYGANHMAELFAADGVDVRAMFTDDIVGASRADDGTSDPRTIRLFAEGVPTSETPEEAETRRSVGARTIRRRASSPASSPTSPPTPRRGWMFESSTDETASCAAVITSRSSRRAIRQRGSPSRTRTSGTSTRTCARRAVSATGTCRSSATSATSPASPRSTWRRSGRWRRGRARPPAWSCAPRT
ncbi:M20/M25/M40 family metallo-hydrolase [Saccharopolyspora terrae]|uniref:M20/M25/M40 family metallo-hydrolase n=1 Tax=Saccharopolyspora terrae TaxID=2530384 RepID=UPI001F18ED8A|nr:M20/M25/M40 family metallo-hydrolase [Saccharopolyspora terrae]